MLAPVVHRLFVALMRRVRDAPRFLDAWETGHAQKALADEALRPTTGGGRQPKLYSYFRQAA